MTTAQILSFAVIAAMMAAFIWGRVRYDVVAAVALLVAVAVGVVPFDRAFSGFADDIVIIVASALVVSAAVSRSGVMELALQRLAPNLSSPRLQLILLVTSVWGMTSGPEALLVLPVALLVGLCFAGLGLAVTAVSPSYDFFMYYFTLVIGPMIFLSGVFYPVGQLPVWLQWFARVLPLTHAVELVRPLLLGAWPKAPLINVLVLAVYGAGGFQASRWLARRRLMK